MNVIIETLRNAFADNLEIVALLLIADFGTTLVNILLGTIIGTMEESFDLKKFLFGFVKLFASQCLILGFCYFLNLASLAIDLFEKYLKVQIFTDDAQTLIVAVVDVGCVIIARLKDTCIDVLEKVKSMRTLKYIKYEDIQINVQSEKGIG